MASAPVPQKRSSTRASEMSPRIEKTASRTRSVGGRSLAPLGARMRRPPSSPPVIRSSAISGRELLDPLVAEASPRLFQQRADLRRLERTEALAQLHHPAASLEQERGVLRQRGGTEPWQAVLAGGREIALPPDREGELGPAGGNPPPPAPP